MTYFYAFRKKKSWLKEMAEFDDGKDVPVFILIDERATREDVENFFKEQYDNSIDMRTGNFIQHTNLSMDGKQRVMGLGFMEDYMEEQERKLAKLLFDNPISENS